MRFVGYTTVDQPLIAKVLTDKDLAIQDLKNNFFTRRGERLMDPDFGSIIPEMIFEPLDDITKGEIQADAERIISLDPRWNLLDSKEPTYLQWKANAQVLPFYAKRLHRLRSSSDCL